MVRYVVRKAVGLRLVQYLAHISYVQTAHVQLAAHHPSEQIWLDQPAMELAHQYSAILF